MSKFVITTALALVLAGGAYAQDHHGGMGGGGGPGASGGHSSAAPGGGGGPGASGGHSFAAPGGGGAGRGPSMMSRGSSGPSFSNSGRMPTSGYNGRGGMQTYRGSQFSHNTQGPQGRTLYNQQRNASRDIERGRSDRNLYNKYSDRDQYGHKGDHDHDMDFRHRGVVSGNFHEHGRHFHYRRFWNGAWVFLNDWDDCTAWMWVHVAPGLWAWRPVDVCIG